VKYEASLWWFCTYILEWFFGRIAHAFHIPIVGWCELKDGLINVFSVLVTIKKAG
jgi:hypothetical protein